MPLRTLPMARKCHSYVEHAKVPLPERLQPHNLVQRLALCNVFMPDFLAQVDMVGPWRDERGVWTLAERARPLIRMLAYDRRYTLPEAVLPKVRGSKQLADVEVGFRIPDQELVDFPIGLPPEYKLNGLKLRRDFKEALRGFLPDEILVKKKRGFGRPFGMWARRRDGLNCFAADSLHTLAERDLVRPGFSRLLVESCCPTIQVIAARWSGFWCSSGSSTGERRERRPPSG